MSFKTNDSIFNVEMDFEQIIEVPDDCVQIRLSELGDGDTFTGKPQMSNVITATYDDGFDNDGNVKTKEVHKIRLVITNEKQGEYLDININLKSPDLEISSIRKGSVLFDFIQSILELENMGCTAGKNIFRNVNLKQFIDFINNLEILGIKAVARKGTFNFNSFYVIRCNNQQSKL